GALVNAGDYIAAQQVRTRLVHEMNNVMSRFDALVIPGSAGPAPLLSAVDPIAYFDKPSLTAPFNVTGHPAISLCSGFSSDGLPLSLQVVGRLFQEHTLLQLAQAYESATSWRNVRPDLSPFMEKEGGDKSSI